MRDISINIVNMINKNFDLKLFTVDSSQMTDEIKELLEKELPKPTKSAIQKEVLYELNEVLRQMNLALPEYHKEIVEEAIKEL